MNRPAQTALIASMLISSWFGMQLVHELGHVLAARATGGTVERVVFHPLTISRTDVAPNPLPLVVAWAGPLVGTLLPLALAGIAKQSNFRGRRHVHFFAGFCLIANGAYLGIGSIDSVGDAGELLRHGSPAWLLVAFGATAVVLGIWIWHRTSGDFGFGRSPRAIGGRETCVASATAAVVTIIAAAFGSH
jgi:hypothetical protein